MKLSKLRIISRESPLAMWQANHVRDTIRSHHPGLEVEIIGIKTQADRFLDASLPSLGGKGVFVKELEQALLEGSADLAVHSMKDVTIDLPEPLALPVIMQREDVRDVMISNQYREFAALPPRARIGTSSLRRRCQIKAIRPDLEILDIRGNVGTRLGKLDAGHYDALILAAAGVKRLGLAERISEFLDTALLLPAIGQGALGLETRAGDSAVQEIIAPLNDMTTHTCLRAERSLSRTLYGGCHVPVAGHAVINGNNIHINALVGRLDGSEIIRSSISGGVEQGEALGITLGRELLGKGADAILRELLDD